MADITFDNQVTEYTYEILQYMSKWGICNYYLQIASTDIPAKIIKDLMGVDLIPAINTVAEWNTADANGLAQQLQSCFLSAQVNISLLPSGLYAIYLMNAPKAAYSLETSTGGTIAFQSRPDF